MVSQRYNDACNQLAEAVNKQLFNSFRKWYWISEEVGGVCDFGGVDILNLNDMMSIICFFISYDEYAEWRDAILDHHMYINLKSWLMGVRHEMLRKVTTLNIKKNENNKD